VLELRRGDGARERMQMAVQTLRLVPKLQRLNREPGWDVMCHKCGRKIEFKWLIVAVLAAGFWLPWRHRCEAAHA
jgi:hypothetical protein